MCVRRVWAPRISTLYHVEYIFTTRVRIGKRTARLYENYIVVFRTPMKTLLDGQVFRKLSPLKRSLRYFYKQ